MANPNPFNNTVLQGDLTVQAAPNVAANGPGNLYVEGKTLLQSTASDALRVKGSSIFDVNVNVGGYVTVASGKWQSSNSNNVIFNANNDSVVLRNVEGQVAGQFASTVSDFSFFDSAGSSVVNIHKADGAVTVNGNVSALSDLSVQGNALIRGDTVIEGDLSVLGLKTKIETQVTTVKDNVLCVNYSPALFNDGGYAIKRFQPANDSSDGAVVQDDPYHDGTVVSATSTAIVLDSSASAADDMYSGAWIKIQSGPGNGQVRRIKAYVGSTRTATIYTSADHTATPKTPVEGMDFTVLPTSSSTYALYVNQFVISYWRESTNEYVLGASCGDPTSNPTVSTYTPLDVRAGNLKLEKILNVDVVNGYTAGHGVTVSAVNANNGALTGVTTINGALPPAIQTVSLIDNSSSPVALQTVRQSGLYLIIVNSTDGTSASGLFVANKIPGQQGGINRLAATTGSAGERIDMIWPTNGNPSLYFSHLPTSGSGATLAFSATVYT